MRAEIRASRSDAETHQPLLGAEVPAGSRAGAGGTPRPAAVAGSVLPALVGFCASSVGESWHLRASLSRWEISGELEAALNLGSLGIGL